MNKSFKEIVNDVLDKSDITSDVIPDLDLYIDQITTLLDRYFANHKRNPDDKIMTKTMVNNYCKQGVVQSISGKKYSKDRIIQILMVYAMKNTLTIEEIKRLMQQLFTMIENENTDIYRLYDRFVENKVEKKEVVRESINDFLEKEELDIENNEDRIVMILELCALSDIAKNVAQEMIQCYYPEVKKK